VGTRITLFVIFHSYWSSLSKDSSVSLHCSFLHSFRRRVTDLWRRLTWPFRAGSLVTCHFLRNLFFRHISSWILACREVRGQTRGLRLRADAAVASWVALVSSSTHLSIASSSITTWFPGICLHGKPGMQPSPFAWSRGVPVGFEMMINMWCWSEQVGDPSWMQNIQSDAPVERSPWQPQYQGCRGDSCVCKEP
jgi:hypothetical protein